MSCLEDGVRVFYGHYFMPVQKCALPMLYTFVHIAFDAAQLLACLKVSVRIRMTFLLHAV